MKKMMKMKKALVFTLLCVAVLLALASPALAVTYSGGTDGQRAYAQEVIESCRLDYQWIDARVDGIDLLIAEHYDPYWEFIDHDPLRGVAGLAWWGNIVVHAGYPPGYNSFFGEIVAHEWCHQIWFGMPLIWRLEWGMLCTEGIDYWDSTQWLQMPEENFAECARVAMFDQKYQYNPYPRTHLNVISQKDTANFILTYRWWTENHFPDLEAEDYELKAAAGYLSHEGVILGYVDGTMGPYQPLTKRHVALMAERMGLECELSTNDYQPALRGDVRDNIPDLTWLEERWDEQITRGQLARLMWRTQLDLWGECYE